MLELHLVSVWCHLLRVQNLEFCAEEYFKMVSKTVQKAQISLLLSATAFHVVSHKHTDFLSFFNMLPVNF